MGGGRTGTVLHVVTRYQRGGSERRIRDLVAALPTTDRRTYRALKNVRTEIGEAVKLIPPEFLARHKEVEWRGWAGQRDVVSHQYFSLELPRLRPTVMDELPVLLEAVTAMLAAMPPGPG